MAWFKPMSEGKAGRREKERKASIKRQGRRKREGRMQPIVYPSTAGGCTTSLFPDM